MSLSWMPRDDKLRDHQLFGSEHWGSDDQAPCVVYTKKPLTNPATGAAVPDLYVAEIRLNNPRQYNSYTTEMVKGVIAGFFAASGDRSVVAAIFTGTGFDAFCTGGNTKEYSEYYSRRPHEYGEYMDLFNQMVDAILMCKKPTICRVNGMRVAGGQEIGMACDLAVSSDLAIFGQAGARHGGDGDHASVGKFRREIITVFLRLFFTQRVRLGQNDGIGFFELQPQNVGGVRMERRAVRHQHAPYALRRDQDAERRHAVSREPILQGLKDSGGQVRATSHRLRNDVGGAVGFKRFDRLNEPMEITAEATSRDLTYGLSRV